ncbi:uncharacterized protein ASPGLDRAFT_36958 [Aspergillus glaucus CBS 516.65]|uniref:Uncharacterized protein n=1 Tax=Aspergillus glaucus CBS 516.65 TaxID=1160497 RepID=A0A1L9VG10_ASPGL|nr:hypothetical protein ASPGLDRAFT_36958 [Aspergillus glaucus CBS 516.65]OJJ82846.1 hypothetical protein ASPGLDRAFT_36958 [Aspergillus glaucus CBS 516.65]
MEDTFLLYGKSDKQYLVLPRGGSELKLVTNPEFRERENGYLSEPSQIDVRNIPTSPPTGSNSPVRPPAEAPAQEPIETPSRDPRMPTEAPAREQLPVNESSHTDEPMNDITPEPPKLPNRENGEKERDSSSLNGGMTDNPLKLSEEVQSKGETEQQSAPERHATEEVCEITPPETEEEPLNAGTERMPDKTPVRRSERVCQPSTRLVESQQMDGLSRKRKAEGEESSDRPAQRL